MSKTTSGNKIYVDDALRAPLLNFEVDGNTTQASSILPSGYTQVDYITLTAAYINTSVDCNMDYTIETKLEIVSPTTVANIQLYGTLGNQNTTSWYGTGVNNWRWGGIANNLNNTVFNTAGTYTITHNKSKIIINGTTYNYSSTGSMGTPTSIVVGGTGQENNVRYYYFRIYNAAGTVIRDFVPCYRNSDNAVGFFDIQTNAFYGNSNTTAIHYGAVVNVPNPSYPVAMNSIGYKNIVESSHVVSTTQQYQNVLYIKGDLQPCTQYTISFEGTAGNQIYLNENLFTQVTFYVANGRTKVTSRTKSVISKDNTRQYDSSVGWIIFKNYQGGVSSANVFNDLLIEKGAVAHPFVPYNKCGLEITTTGKNLFNKTATQNVGSQTITQLDTGVRVTATATGTYRWDAWFLPNDLLGKTVTISAKIAHSSENTGAVRLYFFDNSNNAVTNIGTPLSTSGSKTMAIPSSMPSGCTKIGILLYANFDGTGEIGAYVDYTDLQLEVGAQPTIYADYKKRVYTYVLNEPLRAIGSMKDKLYTENGILKVERKIGSSVLDGTENWQDRPNYTYCDRFVKDGYFPNYTVQDARCNYFIQSSVNNTSYPYFKNNVGQCVINFSAKGMTTLAQFKTWLSINKPTVEYVLATPIIEEIGCVDFPELSRGANYIEFVDNLSPTINITYQNDISSADKAALRANTAAIKCKLIVLADGNLPAIELTENNSVKDWEYTDERLVPGKGFVGQFVGRTLDGNLQNISDTFDILNREINLQLGIYRINNDVTTWYDYGNFIVTEPEDNEVNDNTKFETMDYAKLFNKPFNGDYTDDTFTTSYNDLMGVNLTDEERAAFVVTPVTARWVALYTCAQVGVTLATTTFINSDFEIDINPFQAGETCRDVMKEIGKLALSWVRIGWDNRCYIDFCIQDVDTVDSYDVLDNDQYFSLETTEETTPVDGVGFGMQDVDGETAFKIKNDGPIDSAENILYVYDNPFLYTFDKRYQAVQQANAIFGLTYMQLKTETIGHPWLTGTEIINVKNMEDNSNYTYAFNKTIKYTGHIRSIINSIDETEVEKTLGYTSSTVQATRKASISVNKQEGTIELLTSRVSEVETGLGDTYTKEETNHLIEDVSGLTNQYINSGGANKFRNTGLWYKTDDGNGFEYWNGTVVVADDDNSASSTVMMLQNSTLTQTLSNVPNGDYTISFKYEKLNPTSTLQILINSTDYSELLSTSGTFEKTITVSTNSIEISFVCNTNNSWKVYELMCNVGATPLVWTQHPNEVRTDTVNISKGITITSTTTNAVFKANADGIRIENQAERTTTNFLEDGMETDNATIRKQARVSGALHTIVGNQTWISGIL